MEIKKVAKGYIIPSAAITLSRKHIKGYVPITDAPKIGDVIYGVVERLGQHRQLENGEGRLHNIHPGTKAVFVYGNRYAPDYYEAFLPKAPAEEVDLLARSGLIGEVESTNSSVIDPTRVRIIGQVCNAEGQPLNTTDFPAIAPKGSVKKTPRAKLVLVIGTSMNAGKSMAAVACCRTLSIAGLTVRASKVTGTASLKDILHMNDAGADPYSDFSFLGYPSTYMLSEEEVLRVFDTLDLKYANNKENYWVVEFADGILQRETAMLLRSESVRSRIHKLIFCAGDAFGAIGGLQVLKDDFGLVPDALSGVCSSSPLHIKELKQFTNIPVFNSMFPEHKMLKEILVGSPS